jgi:hypothetical protein
MIVFIVYICLLTFSFLFYKHVLRENQNWILSRKLYIMSCVCEMRYQTIAKLHNSGTVHLYALLTIFKVKVLPV